MTKRILLVDPDLHGKYPPLGLMKISQYHKQKGHEVRFVRGLRSEERDGTEWDRVYVSSLFTFNWKQTIKALQFYRYSVKEPLSDNLVVGGMLATLMGEDIRRTVECRVVQGLLDSRGKLGYHDDEKIDSLLPDYGMLREAEPGYALTDAYIAYATRGCPRRCEFCAVSAIEPRYKHFLPIAEQIRRVEEAYGRRRNLLLLDNNVLQSRQFPRIIREIKEAGFAQGATMTYESRAGRAVTVRRWVDFNQGVDIRILDEPRMALLSEIAIRPLRFAFDDVALRQRYEEKVRLAAKHGIRRLSNYVLFNFKDRPEDLYERLRINIDLNEELGLQIYSFPMRYISLENKSRSADVPGNIGPHWNRKYLRAIQCILAATRGIVSPNRQFFEAAFGRDVHEFRTILLMPEDYIIHRQAHVTDGSAAQWWSDLNDLDDADRQRLEQLLHTNRFTHSDCLLLSTSARKVVSHYVGEFEQMLLL